MRSLLWLMLGALVCAPGCRSEQPAVDEPKADEADATELRTPPPQPPPLLGELGRVSVDGKPFALALDGQGQLVVSTMRGRAAAYLVAPDAPLGAAPAALELDDFASSPLLLADGVFALPLFERKQLLLARAAAGKLELLGSFTLPGKPAGAAMAWRQLWIALRENAEGVCLVAFDPASGALQRSLRCDATPVELASEGPPGAETLLLTLLASDAKHGELARLRTADGELARSAVDGVPLHAVTLGATTWVRRHERPDLLPLGESLQPSAALELPFAPSLLRPLGDPERATALLAVSANGHAAIIDAGASPAVRHHRELLPGISDLVVERSGARFLALDAKRQSLCLYRSSELQELACAALASQVGRVAWDELRGRAYVSLPEREEIVVLGVARGE